MTLVCSSGKYCMSNPRQYWSWLLPCLSLRKSCCPSTSLFNLWEGGIRLTISCFFRVACVFAPHVLQICGTYRAVTIKYCVERLEVGFHNCSLIVPATKRGSRVKKRTSHLEVCFPRWSGYWSWCKKSRIWRYNWLRIRTGQTCLSWRASARLLQCARVLSADLRIRRYNHTLTK